MCSPTMTSSTRLRAPSNVPAPNFTDSTCRPASQQKSLSCSTVSSHPSKIRNLYRLFPILICIHSRVTRKLRPSRLPKSWATRSLHNDKHRDSKSCSSSRGPVLSCSCKSWCRLTPCKRKGDKCSLSAIVAKFFTRKKFIVHSPEASRRLHHAINFRCSTWRRAKRRNPIPFCLSRNLQVWRAQMNRSVIPISCGLSQVCYDWIVLTASIRPTVPACRKKKRLYCLIAPLLKLTKPTRERQFTLAFYPMLSLSMMNPFETKTKMKIGKLATRQ